MRAKAIRVRRQKLADLAKKDRAARCGHCQKPLGSGWVQPVIETKKYCDTDCMEAEAESWEVEKGE